ncbi:hypothetical protein [Streptomyces niveus]
MAVELLESAPRAESAGRAAGRRCRRDRRGRAAGRRGSPRR